MGKRGRNPAFMGGGSGWERRHRGIARSRTVGGDGATASRACAQLPKDVLIDEPRRLRIRNMFFFNSIKPAIGSLELISVPCCCSSIQYIVPL